MGIGVNGVPEWMFLMPITFVQMSCIRNIRRMCEGSYRRRFTGQPSVLASLILFGFSKTLLVTMGMPFESATKNPLRLICSSMEFMKTLYLFGKSDIPAATLPSVCIISCFLFRWMLNTEKITIALVLSGPSTLHLIAKGFLWNQLHLLTFQVYSRSFLACSTLLRLTLA